MSVAHAQKKRHDHRYRNRQHWPSHRHSSKHRASKSTPDREPRTEQSREKANNDAEDTATSTVARSSSKKLKLARSSQKQPTALCTTCGGTATADNTDPSGDNIVDVENNDPSSDTAVDCSPDHGNCSEYTLRHPKRTLGTRSLSSETAPEEKAGECEKLSFHFIPFYYSTISIIRLSSVVAV